MIPDIDQYIPSDTCLACDVCCRYPKWTTSFVPAFIKDEADVLPKNNPLICVGKKSDLKTPPCPHGEGFICSFFDPGKNGCRIYAGRPFDCRLYPLMITYSEDYSSVILALDSHCPYCRTRAGSPGFKAHADSVAGLLEKDLSVEMLNQNKHLIGDFQKDSVAIARLENVSRRLCLSGYALTRISLNDKDLFNGYCAKIVPELSSFSFAAQYIWSGHLHILWKEIDGALCVFAGNNRDYFLMIPPVKAGDIQRAVTESFEILSQINGAHSPASRIENVPRELFDTMRSSGLVVRSTTEEYIYEQKSLAALPGDAYKSKRSSINNLMKHHACGVRSYEPADAFPCLEIYRVWASQRLERAHDDYFRFLLEDGYSAHKTALMHAAELGLAGYVAEIEGRLKGYSLGYRLRHDLFVVLFETTDLTVKGLSQFLFREFARRLSSYSLINAMGDSGLDNLRKVKESYRPAKKIPLFTAQP